MRGPIRQKAANLLAWVYAVATVVAAFLWLSYRLVHHVPRVSWLELAFAILNIPVTASLVSVVGLGLITTGLLRRKRLALIVVLVF
ncbi:MAG: hypothetical protein Q4G35_08400 [Propionibacteriaceae bacterium]|nr:hypothetical protein [Propionibacteriaceae bacterium]